MLERRRANLDVYMSKGKRKKKKRWRKNLPGCSMPLSETGVRGQIKSGKWGVMARGALRADNSRCQSLQDIFSRRRPS